MRLEHTITIITGAARGMGEAEGRLFAAEGCRVVLADVLDREGRWALRGVTTSAAIELEEPE